MSSKLDKNKIFSSMATEHTLKEVVTAVKSISINVGDIVLGDVTVESNDTETHAKLDTLTTTLSSKRINKTTDSVDISGQRVDISGQTLFVNTISGFSTSALQTTGNDKLDTLNTTITNKYINKTTDSVDVSGQRVDISGQTVDISGQTLHVNTISGFTLNTTTLSTNDTLNRILNKGGDIQANIYYTEGASVWADSVPTPTVNVLNPNGWLYTNTNAGNAMNLFYFNGTNETKTLSQVMGQYAVVSNLSTKLNDSMIFGIYTKSATSFFTTRVTHSPVSGVDMAAGGKYLLYWGDVDEYIYPNLPRLNFTNVVTTGTANPSEEILSVTLNTNSSTPAGDVNISIETLGVVFDLEAREYNLLGSPTEYQTLVNIKNKITDIEYKTNLLAFSNTTGINELMTYDRASETKLDTINTTITNKTLSKTTSSIDISGQTLNVNTISGYATSALQTTGNDKLDTLNTTITNKTLDKLTSSIDISGQTLNVNTISGFSTSALQTTGNDKLDTLNTTITNKTLDKLTSSIDISGQTLNVNTISGYATSALQTTGNDKLDTINTTITNKTLNKLTSSIDISGQTLNVNTITGFSTSALQTAGNTSLSDIKTNSDKLKYVNDDLKAVISNTGFDAKIRDKDGNAITSTAVGIDGIRGLDVVLKNGTPAAPISVLIDPTNVLTCAVNNFPAEYPISAGGTLSSALGALNVNLRNTAGDAVGITGAPLVVQNSNNISGYALESGGNLASIKSNSDKFIFTGDFLKTQVNNGLTNPFIVTSTNPSTNYSLETGGNLAAIKVNSDKNTYTGNNLNVNVAAGSISVSSVNIKDTSGNNIYADPSGNLKTNIQNSSLDTHCYGSSNGTNWHHLSTDANGQLNVHSKLQDGAGTDLTSTLNGAKQSLDVNVSNTVPVSGSFYPATQPVSGSINIGSGATTAGLSIIATDIPSSERGLVTASCLYAKAPALSGVPSTPITAILNGARAYLETRDEDAVAELTSIDTGVATTNTRLTTTNTTLSAISSKLVTQTNAGNTAGLNVYNIYPNKLIYRMAGSASAPVVNQFLGPEALAFDGTTFNIGLNYPSNFNIYLTAAGTRSVDLDYIDANGNRILSTITINNTDQVRLSNAININNMNWTPTSGNVDTKLRAIARTGVYRNQLSTFLSGAGVITVPNGYIGVVSNLYYYAAVGDDVYMIVKDKYNNHKTSRFMPQPISAAGKYTNVGDINEPLIAGDSVYFLSGQSGSGQKYLNAIVTMEPL